MSYSMVSDSMINDREPSFSERSAEQYAFNVFSHENGKGELWHGGNNSYRKAEAFFKKECLRLKGLVDNGELETCTVTLFDEEENVVVLTKTFKTRETVAA